MKTILKSLTLVAVVLSTACSNENKTETSQNDLIPQKVLVKLEQNLIVPSNSEIFKSIDDSAYSNYIIEQTLNGKIPVFDAQDTSKQLSAKEINSIIGTNYDTLIDISEQTLDTIVSVKKHTFNPLEIERLLFVEDWHFNSKEFKFTKNITQISPIRVYYKESDTLKKEQLKQMLYWYKFNNKQIDKNKLKLLTENVTYEFSLYNSTNPTWIESLSPSRFIDILLSNVLTGKQPAYDFFTKDTAKLTINQIKENLGETIENYYIENPETGVYDTVEVKNNFYPDEIMSVIFVEDWYLDESTLKIYKFVKKIAPVRQYLTYDENGEEEYEKKIPFYVNINQ